MDASPPLFRSRPGRFVVGASFFHLARLAEQNNRGSVVMDFPHLEVFYAVGRGGDRYHQTPVVAGVIGVYALQMFHEIGQHFGHLIVPRCRSFGCTVRK
jgi:hypothetical protein